MFQTATDDPTLVVLGVLAFAMALYIVFVTIKNYKHISNEHAGVIILAWIIMRVLDISTILIVIVWRTPIFEQALSYATTVGLYELVFWLSDIWVPMLIVYSIMMIPKFFLAVIVSRHRKQSGRGSALYRILDNTIMY
jgi:hypothetical protein